MAVDGPTAEDVLALGRALDGDAFLRRALSDPSTPAEARRQVAAALFADKVTPGALKVLQAAAAATWPDGHVLVLGLERAGVRAVWLWADRAGIADRVTDELFALGQLVTTTPELRRAVTDFTADPGRRRALIRQVAGAKVAPQTLALAEHAVVTRHATFEDAVRRDLALGAQLKGTAVAVATVARPLSPGQRDRLANSLSRRAGRAVKVEEVVDPSVLGGVRVELGDDIIDGTMTARLAAARRHLTQPN
ncbi:MAG: F0F1 ATP synthase subunit delta [Propionibacteriaceae bacterium]|nr:F0F1 ATP synthase subunit delta [Propionibacteriaceae bacterium]